VNTHTGICTAIERRATQVVYAGLIVDMSSRSPGHGGLHQLMKRLDDMIAMFEDAAFRGIGRAVRGLVCFLFCLWVESNTDHHH
jgi:hypothetical protein